MRWGEALAFASLACFLVAKQRSARDRNALIALCAASRMKTTGLPDYIHISESTYELVKDDTTLIYEQRKTQVKGKGDMNTYLLARVLGKAPLPL